MRAGTIEATPLAVDFAKLLRDVITDCEDLSAAMKQAQAAAPEDSPVRSAFARLRLKVACLRSSAVGASSAATALAMTGQPVAPATLPPAPQAEPEELHVHHQSARRRAQRTLCGKDLAAGEHMEVER